MVSSYSRSGGAVVADPHKYVTSARHVQRQSSMRHRPSSSRHKVPGHFTGGLDEAPATEPLPPRIGDRPGSSIRGGRGPKTQDDEDYTPAKRKPEKANKASPKGPVPSPGPVPAEKAIMMTVVQFNDAIQRATNQAVTKILEGAGQIPVHQNLQNPGMCMPICTGMRMRMPRRIRVACACALAFACTCTYPHAHAHVHAGM